MSSTGVLTFGTGSITVKPICDAYGVAIAYPTPVFLGTLTEFSFEISGDTKEFYGRGQYPLAIARGKAKTQAKGKGAVLAGRTIDTLYFGTGTTAGTMRAMREDMTGAKVPASSALTAAPPNSGTFVEDLGVTDAQGNPFVRVASAPTTGKYAVSATGVYTFAGADVGKPIFINYNYSYALPAAQSIDLLNLPMGSLPSFSMVYFTQFQGKSAMLELSNVNCPKLGLFTGKNDDFNTQELEFGVQADPSGRSVGRLTLSE